MRKIQKALLDKLSEDALSCGRKRKNFNFHDGDSDLLQRMLNALEPATYVRPHKHINPEKREAYILLRGKIAIVEFDEAGNVSDHVILDHSDGNYAAEITPGSWHSVISFESGSVYYEVKDGPYDASTDKVFADWSPAEGTAESATYLENLKNILCSV